LLTEAENLSALHKELRQLTFDQLRTLVLLARTGSALRTAALLDRDQSSVQKQLATLNKHFKEICGEPLARTPTGRGKALAFTRTGELVADLANSLFVTWLSALDEHRRRVGKSVSIGATAFILDFVPKAWDKLVKTLADAGIAMSVTQIHTKDVLTALRQDKELDLVLGGVIMERTLQNLDHPDYESLGWHREPFVLLTNYTKSLLPDEPVAPDTLRTLILILPDAGIIHDFLKRWFGDHYRAKLKVFPVTGDVPFSLSLLRSGSVKGCILVPEYLVKSRSHYTKGLRVLKLSAPDLPDLHVVASILMRRGDREDKSEDHPLNLIWNVFVEEARKLKGPK
jgi:DNA-binding transcriptional LysR family regulator